MSAPISGGPSGYNPEDEEMLLGARRITRKAYIARRRGKTIRVKAAKIQDRGAPGRWQSVHGEPGIGPLGKDQALVKRGYSHKKSAKARHAALNKTVRAEGALSTLRKVNAIAVYNKRTAPSRARTYRSDVRYLQKKYFKK